MFIFKKTVTGDKENKTMQEKLTNIIPNILSKENVKLQKTLRIAAAMLSCFAITIGAAYLFVLKAHAEKKSALYIDGSIACYISDASTYENAVNMLSENYDSDFGHDIEMEVVEVTAKTASETECYSILVDQLQKDRCDAYVICADKNKIAAFASANEAAEALSCIKETINDLLASSSESKKILTAEVVNEFSIEKEENCLQSELTDKDSFVKAVIDEFKEKVQCSFASGTSDNTDELPKVADNNTSVVLQSNVMEKSVSLPTEEQTHSDLVCFKIRLVLEMTETEPIAPAIRYEDSNEYRVGETVLGVQGENGTAEVTYEVEYISGTEQSRTEISRNVIKQPKDTVMYVGTKPLTDPTGEFDYPLKDEDNFYLSSEFGVNRGYYFDRNAGHAGIDLACKSGTPIYAADGGKVLFAGWKGSYGYVVMLDHDGIQTNYAHMSAYCVKTGDLVCKGQQIGNVGSTGKSTGPHLHFEVKVNGKLVNPFDYLPEKDINVRLCW